jgi:ankyrin repeat protein
MTSIASVDGMLQQVRRLMEGLPLPREFALVSAGRTFRREGSLSLWCSESNDWQDIYAYLFSDVFLWGVTKRNSITSALYTFECLVTLDTGDVVVNAGNDNSVSKLSPKQAKIAGHKVSLADVFEIRSDPASYAYLFRAVTAADAEAWSKTLRKCLVDAVRARRDAELAAVSVPFTLAAADEQTGAAPAASSAGAAASGGGDDDESESESSSSAADRSAGDATKHKKRINPFRRSRRIQKLAGFSNAEAAASNAAAAAIKSPKPSAAAAPEESDYGSVVVDGIHALVDQNDVKGVKRLLRRRTLGKEMFSLLELDAAGLTVLNKALNRKLGATVDLLLDDGVMSEEELTGKDALDNTALHAAAAADNVAVIAQLLRRSADLVRAKNKAGDTPLHLFCESTTNDGCLKVGVSMIDAGAAVDARNVAGETPLHKVSLNGSKPFVLLQLTVMLLSHKAQPNPASEQLRETPLHYAARHRRKDVAMQLMQAGADHTLKNSEGFTALDIAVRFKHDDVEQAITHVIGAVSFDKIKAEIADSGVLAVLRTPALNKALFMNRESRLAGESIAFWNAAEEYAALADADERVERARDIFERFFDKASEQEIDVGKKLRREVRHNLSAGAPTLFLAVQEAVVATLEGDLESEGLKVFRRAPANAPEPTSSSSSGGVAKKKKKVTATATTPAGSER